MLNMKNSFLIKCALISASLPLFVGCVEREVVYRDRPAPAPVVEEEVPPPPAPQAEIITVAPGPTEAWYWAPGAYEWRGHWVWVGGHWVARPHPGAVWAPAHWAYHGHHRVWVSGGWR
jgi:hypothetical protein